MEFNSDVSRLLGIILSLRRRGFLQNSDPAKEEVEELSKLFDSIEDSKIILQMVFFMILNADMSASHILSTNKNLGPLICVSPPLKEKLVVQLIWKLKHHKQLNLIIRSCSSFITGNMIVLFIKEVDKSAEDIKELCELMCALFIKIYHVYLNLQKDKGISTIFFCFENIHHCLIELFKTCVPVTKPLTNDESICSFAKKLFIFLESLFFMLKISDNPHFIACDNYLFKGAINLEIQCNDMLEYDVELFKACIKIIFKSFNEVMEIITVDLWSLFSALPDYLLNEDINEFFILICKEAKNRGFNCSNIFEKFKMKPKSKIEKILGKSEVQSDFDSWNDALESYFGISNDNISNNEVLISETEAFKFFKEERVVNCILKFLDKFDVKLINRILKECLKILQDYNNDEFIRFEPKIIKIFLKALKRSNGIDYRSLFREIFVTHSQIGNKFKIGVLDEKEMENFNERLIKTFNQDSIEKLPEMSELASLCLESTEKTLRQICSAATYGYEQSEFYSEVIYTFEDAFAPFLVGVLENAIKYHNFSEKEKNCFLTFVTKIQNYKLLRPPFYYKVFGILNGDLQAEKHDRIIFLLKLIQIGLASELFVENKFIFLVYMSRVLEFLSWDLESFSMAKCQGTLLADEVVSGLLQNVNEEDEGSCLASWAVENIKDCSEMTRAHFCNLWSRLGRPWPMGSAELPTVLFNLINSEEEDETLPKLETMESVTLSLAMLIPRLTINMWLILFEFLKRAMEQLEKDCLQAEYQTIVLFSSAIYLLTLVLNDNSKTFDCYEYCLRNFGRIVKSISHEMKELFSGKILERITFFLQKIKDEDQKESSSIALLPALICLCEKVKFDYVSNLIFVLKVKKVEEAICNSFKGVVNGNQKMNAEEKSTV